MRLGKQQLTTWLDEHRTLWWWVADVTKLSDESILEGVMNYGDWKDFLNLKKIFGLKELQSNEKLFREQLSYFQDINYSEPIEYLPGMAVSDEIIKQKLKKIAIM